MDSPPDPQTMINEVAKKLKSVVAKVNFSFDPINISVCDDADELINRVNVEIGKLELIVDEVYRQMHMFKFMGLRVESKKSLTVLGSLIKVKRY